MNEESKKLYEGKYFYKVSCRFSGGIELHGPFEDIYYVTDRAKNGLDVGLTGLDLNGYEFVQVTDGTIERAFKKDEILVTDRIL